MATPLMGQQPDTIDHSVAPTPVRPAAWVKEQDFPSAAKAKGNHGAVRFVLAIDAGGSVYRCDIVKTSGFALLDQQTCALMLRKAKFDPAMDQSGTAAASEWSRMIAWGQTIAADPMANYDLVIKVASLPAEKRFLDVVLRTVVSADGQLEVCTVQTPSGLAALDRQACDLAGQTMSSQPLKAADGTPVRGVRTQRMGFLVEAKDAPPRR